MDFNEFQWKAIDAKIHKNLYKYWFYGRFWTALEEKVERATRIELATPTLARSCSTAELHPHPCRMKNYPSGGKRGDNTAEMGLCKGLKSEPLPMVNVFLKQIERKYGFRGR